MSTAKIAPFLLGMIICIARAAEFPDGERRIVRRYASQDEDDSFRTKSHTWVFTAMCNGQSRVSTIALDVGVGAERHRQRPVIPQTVTGEQT